MTPGCTDVNCDRSNRKSARMYHGAEFLRTIAPGTRFLPPELGFRGGVIAYLSLVAILWYHFTQSAIDISETTNADSTSHVIFPHVAGHHRILHDIGKRGHAMVS
ncbi:hypothetical protein BD410DRAFT_106342 [Rickenella mellea]|uniref:Uncharacterized protein n=1 Tax=Rickenella mellea TaxID=50990 RepID=A0A4Y7PJ76_9AGAM|nr:hypothetical protein BD410DRAFT_106342 [Rickenella mellea]